MSNHFNNILDGEELIQNSSLQSAFTPYWEKIERLIYRAHSVFLVLFLIMTIIIAFNFSSRIYHDYSEFLFSFFSPLILLIAPLIYIHLLRHFKNQVYKYQSTSPNSRLAFLIITPFLLLMAIITILLAGFLFFFALYFSIDAIGDAQITMLIGFTLLISVPLFITNAFLIAYYIYSIRFFYRINDTPIDDILN
jgi:hypothetical protein